MAEDIEDIDDFTEEESEDFRYSITSYGADYTVDRIVTRLDSGKILIPKFQRKYVWNIKEASRFIESLILGLPVPGVFFTQEKSTGKMLVIDGQQRLLSLQKFYKGRFNSQIFKLKGVQADLEGKSIDELSPSDKDRLDDTVIHATVIKQDSPDDDTSSIYMVFERLNTGGMKLLPQEIRSCIYHGPFNEMLSNLSENETWKKIYAADNKRLKSEELILRFFALYESWSDYSKGLKGFLNHYMESNQNISDSKQAELSKLFEDSIDLIYQIANGNGFRLSKNLNAAVFDSVMIAITQLIQSGCTIQIETLKERYQSLLKDSEYLRCVESNTASEASVKDRINKAIDIIVNGQTATEG